MKALKHEVEGTHRRSAHAGMKQAYAERLQEGSVLLSDMAKQLEAKGADRIGAKAGQTTDKALHTFLTRALLLLSQQHFIIDQLDQDLQSLGESFSGVRDLHREQLDDMGRVHGQRLDLHSKALDAHARHLGRLEQWRGELPAGGTLSERMVRIETRLQQLDLFDPDLDHAKASAELNGLHHKLTIERAGCPSLQSPTGMHVWYPGEQGCRYCSAPPPMVSRTLHTLGSGMSTLADPPSYHFDPQGPRGAPELGPSFRLLTMFLDRVRVEVVRARTKFPSPDMLLPALIEEVGELAQAVMELERGGEPEKYTVHHMVTEAIQVAAMAVRIGLEGDPRYPHATELLKRAQAEGAGLKREA